MKRRRAIQSILGLPALTALERAAPASPLPQQQSDELPKLTTLAGDAVGETSAKYFSPPQMAALLRLGHLLVPATGGRPGASQAKAAEFLDFLLSQSPPERQKLYKAGLDRLQWEAQRRHGKWFEALSAAEAETVLAPLHEPWTYAAPADPFARFLRAAKNDLIAATLNSREFAEAQTARGGRASGMGTYWLPVD